MKKRVFSLLLAVVMLLSTVALTVSATDTDTDTNAGAATLPVAQNVNGMIINIDGVRDDGEGWGDTPTFQTKYKVSEPAIIFENATSQTEPDDDGNQEAIVEDANPSSLYISTDGKYVYFFYESTHSDFINGHDDPNADAGSWVGATKRGGGTSWGAAALYLFFAPAGVDLESTNVADHEAFRLCVRTITDDSYANNVIETALTTGDQTYVWDHKMGDANKAENGGAWDASQSWSARYFVAHLNNGNKDAGVEDVTYEDYGQDVLDDTHIAMRVEGEPSKFTKISLEIAFPISEELSEQLQTGTADYRVATYEVSHRFSEAEVKRGGKVTTVPQNAGYVLSERTLSASNEEENEIKANWCFTKNCGVAFTLPQTSEKAPQVAEAIFRNNVVVDGIMGDEEGWSASPMFQTSLYASSLKRDGSAVMQEDTSPTNIRISCNGRKVYFFVEITHEDTLNAVWRDMNAGKTDENGKPLAKDWQTAALVFHFYPDSDKPRSEYGADNGQWFTLGLATFYPSGLKDSLFDENGTYVWDMNVEQGAVSGKPDDFFWRFLWGSEGSNNYSKNFCLERGVELAAHLDKDENGKRTKLCVEFAFPLADEVVEALEEGDVPYKFTYWERNNAYKDLTQENPTDIISRDAGFFLDETPVDTRVKNDSDDPGKAVILKKNTDTMYRDFMEWLTEYKASATHTNLKDITVNVLGDEYLQGGSLAHEYRWTTMLETIYGWDYNDHSDKGLMMSTYNYIQMLPISKLYRQMSSNDPDLVIINGGWNDYLNNVPIGTIDDTKEDTYMGALNALIKGVRKKYPNACIVFNTVWNFPASNTENTLTYQDYANAMVQVCEARQVYCFKAYDPTVSGVDMSSADFRAENCMSADDAVTLNMNGAKAFMPKYEAFLGASMTDWAANKDSILANQDAFLNGTTGNTGNNGGSNNDDANNETQAPETQAPAPSAPAEKKGCGSVIGAGFAVLAIVSLAGVACCKKH